jgi:enoyl-CoA hydratase
MSDDLVVRVEGCLGRITLNRPKAINALTLGMVREIVVILADWKTAPEVKAVLFDGAGERGFCAGGDIRALYDAVIGGVPEEADGFFLEEYRLNATIGGYPKPIVAILDGIVMGGGIGLGGHASHRIVTERSVLAMPEVGIGFIPDVGGTYLLGCAPDELGVHAALTAGRLGPEDAILCGLADRYAPSAKIADLVGALRDAESEAAIAAVIDRFAETPPGGALSAARSWIAACYAHDTVEEIVAALAASPISEAQAAASLILKNSPTTLKATLRGLRAARRFGRLEPCLEQEFLMASASMRSLDFAEGVAAAIVRKDRAPKWRPADLALVSPEMVERYFQPSGPDILVFD